MSSLNPVFVFPGALDGDAEEISALARQYVAAVTGSSGQLCTSPGLLFAPAGAAGDAFGAAVGRAVSACAGQTMLTEGIAGSWHAGADALGSAGNVSVVGQGADGATKNAPAPAIFGTSVAEFVANPVLHQEIFGAASLVIRYSTTEELVDAAQRLEGQLTASLQLTESDYRDAAPLLPVLEQKVGRIIVNGWPTGVEVGHAMVHGGPFPATSDTRTTSVGTLAISRFLRPVAYQNLPQELLPAPLQDANPWRLNRRIDGVVQASAAEEAATEKQRSTREHAAHHRPRRGGPRRRARQHAAEPQRRARPVLHPQHRDHHRLRGPHRPRRGARRREDPRHHRGRRRAPGRPAGGPLPLPAAGRRGGVRRPRRRRPRPADLRPAHHRPRRHRGRVGPARPARPVPRRAGRGAARRRPAARLGADARLPVLRRRPRPNRPALPGGGRAGGPAGRSSAGRRP